MALVIKNLNSGYKTINILWGINLKVEDGQCVALVGSNGAGKSTILKSILGLVTPTAGSIKFGGEDLIGKKTSAIVGMGIGLVPEGYKLFRGMTVEENLLMGAYQVREQERVIKRLEEIYDIFPELKERKQQLTGTMSGGQQQMCSIGRGLMGYPNLLMIDELSLGLAPKLVEILIDKIIAIRERTNMSIILVEQDVETAFSIADYGYVIESGRVSMHGDPKNLIDDPFIISSYLGI